MRPLHLIFFFQLCVLNICAQNNNIAWAKGFGGINNDQGNSIAFDKDGNIITVGYFQNTVDFDAGAGVFNMTSNGNFDIFILKSDPQGNFIWAKQIGGNNTDNASRVIVDNANNILITGYFSDTVIDINPDAGVYNLSGKGQSVFILKLDNAGNFIWAVNNDAFESNSLETDNENNIYSSGRFSDTVDFDPGLGVSFLSAGGPSGYILKLDSNGTYIWANKFDGGANVYICNLILDSKKNIYVLGTYQGFTDLDLGPSQYLVNSTGGGSATAIFVVKMDSMRNFLWGKNFTGTDFNAGFVMTTDNDCSVYCTGYFQNTVDFDPGAGISNKTSGGFYDAFIFKLDSAGNYQWSKSYGLAGTDIGDDLITDKNNDILFTAQISGSVNYDSMGITKQTPHADKADNVVFKYNKNGDVLNTYHFGYRGFELIYSMDINSTNDIICTGSFSDSIAFNGNNTITSGLNDVLMYKIHQWPTSVTGSELSNNIHIYPNPTTGNFIVSNLPGNSYTIEIKDLTGKDIYSTEGNKIRHEVNMQNALSGLYIIAIKMSGTVLYSKILKL